MTMNTLHRVGCGLAALDDIVNEVTVTVQTVFLKDLSITRRDHDRFVKVLKSESF